MMIDWRDLFKKYVIEVGKSEGLTFLHEASWTPEEWVAVRTVESEAWFEYDMDRRASNLT